MIFFHFVITGVKLVFSGGMLAWVTATPLVVKSVGEVEKRMVYFLNIPTGVQLNEGWYLLRREEELKVVPSDGDWGLIGVNPAEVIFTGKTPNHEETTFVCVVQRTLALTL